MNWDRSRLLDAVFNDVLHQYETNIMASKLRNLSAKYNKRAQRLGTTLIDLIKSDKRFYCKTDKKTQGWLIAPYDVLLNDFNDTEDELIKWDKINSFMDHSVR